MSDEPILAAIAELRTSLMGRMDRLQASLDGIREDLTATVDVNDRTGLMGQHTRDELRSLADLVAAIQRTQLKHNNRLDDIERRIP
jgi:hypothetical protein